MPEFLDRLLRKRRTEAIDPQNLSHQIVSSFDYLGIKSLLTESNINTLKEEGPMALLDRLDEVNAEQLEIDPKWRQYNRQQWASEIHYMYIHFGSRGLFEMNDETNKQIREIYNPKEE